MSRNSAEARADVRSAARALVELNVAVTDAPYGYSCHTGIAAHHVYTPAARETSRSKRALIPDGILVYGFRAGTTPVGQDAPDR
jgi:hypothetical protein